MLYDLPKAGLVVPCYNEASRFPVKEFTGFLESSSEVRFCFVNDGSSDHTAQVLDDISKVSPGKVCVLDLKHNRGKAEAVRAGVMHLCASQAYEFVGYWDADLSTPLCEIRRFLQVAEALPQVKVLCGSRIRRMGAVIERSLQRHYLGRIFATAVSLILHLPVYDTQCGAKLIKADLARGIFEEPFISNWLFDVELFARITAALGREEALNAIFEVPLAEWREKAGSKLSPLVYVHAPWDLLRIYLRYRGI